MPYLNDTNNAAGPVRRTLCARSNQGVTALAEYEFIVTERRGDVLGISLNRPDRLNAAPPAMFDEIRAAVADLDGARAVLLMGIGRGFCSGADVSDSARTVRSEEASYRALTEHYHPALLALNQLPVPVVSAVQGPAAGIGCSLALSADFCIGAQSAYFLQAFVNIGLVPDGGASWLLPRIVGRSRAMQMMMLGERVSAETALEWGLVYRLVPDDLLEHEAWVFADRLANGPTVAMGLMRRGLRHAMESSLEDAMLREAEDQRIASGTVDAREGAAAFLEKRDAVFVGK